MKIILGSQSKWRQNILRDMGYNFEVAAADIDEKSIRIGEYRELPLLIARAKNDALVKEIKDSALLITADSIAVFKGNILEKPKNRNEARILLKNYNTAPVEAITGIVVTNTKNGKRSEGVDICKVFFKEIPDNVIDEFFKKSNVLNCAGSFEIHNPLVRKWISRVEGTIDSVAGLPRDLVKKLIREVEK